jgi:TfoX/Sxy family transcriptional regulator of competence genes
MSGKSNRTREGRRIQMATNREAVEKVLDALEGLDVKSRYVFNGDCLYCDGKSVGWITGRALFLKNTGGNIPGTAGLPLEKTNCKPRPSFIITSDLYKEPWFRGIVQATADALPESEKRW